MKGAGLRSPGYESDQGYLISLCQIVDHPLTSRSEKKAHLRTMIDIYKLFNQGSHDFYRKKIDACKQELRKLTFGFLPWVR